MKKEPQRNQEISSELGPASGCEYVRRKAGVFSGRVKPAKAKVSSPVAWMAGERETELRESIDKAIFRDGERVAGT